MTYRVEPAPQLRQIVNPRRGAIKTVPGLGWKAYLRIKDELFAQFGLEGYVGCVTGEMSRRPVPHVFRTEETQKVTDLYQRRAPAVLRRFLSMARPPLQPLNKQSRLGWPFFDRPESKRARLMPAFAQLERMGAAAILADSFIIMNVRLQPEPVSKERDMMFVRRDGSVYEKKVTAKDRTLVVGDLGELVAARTRLVFNMPYPNLYKQVLDTAIHDVALSFPVFHHNLYQRTGYRPLLGTVRALDVKHFERHTATLARARAAMLGGLYGDIVSQFTAAPFLCPSDDWKQTFKMWPNRSEGYSDQFASGDSAVAPVQKEVFACLYSEFAEKVLGVPTSSSLDWVLQGGDQRLTILNYGDDNILSGDPAVLDEVFSFLGDYLHVEEEDPSKFLGFLWTGDSFKLGRTSYLTKTWLNERAPYTPFRKYPMYGWVEKRKVYSEYGMDDIRGAVFPSEDTLLADAGLPWSDVLIHSQQEALALASRSGAFRNPAWLLDKEYQMTAEEKIATGLYEGIYPAETKLMIQKLLSPTWQSVLP